MLKGYQCICFLQTKSREKHWLNFTPKSSSVICSAHLKKSCFGTQFFIDVPSEVKHKARYLIQDKSLEMSYIQQNILHFPIQNIIKNVFLCHSQLNCCAVFLKTILESCRFDKINYCHQLVVIAETNYLVSMRPK